MKEVCVIGHFAFGEELLNGQTIKTKIIAAELEKQLGEDQVMKIDTHGGKLALFRMIFQASRAMRTCRNVVMLPAHNGVRVFAPLLSFWKKRCRTGLHYIVIGGWLAHLLDSRKRLRESLKKFDGIYVETLTMKKALEQEGFGNVVVMPNCKELHILKPEELSCSVSRPLRLCTFSRVIKEKGIDDAVLAVAEVNDRLGGPVFTLDIYGQIEHGYEDWFRKLSGSFPPGVRYCGCVAYDHSTEILKDYYALLFPTKLYMEGIPGTIIDAYASGLPVISARWESFYDLVEENKVGLGYQLDNRKELVDTLLMVARDPMYMVRMKRACLEKAADYTPEKVVGDFIRRLRGQDA